MPTEVTITVSIQVFILFNLVCLLFGIEIGRHLRNKQQQRARQPSRWIK